MRPLSTLGETGTSPLRKREARGERLGRSWSAWVDGEGERTRDGEPARGRVCVLHPELDLCQLILRTLACVLLSQERVFTAQVRQVLPKLGTRLCLAGSRLARADVGRVEGAARDGGKRRQGSGERRREEAAVVEHGMCGVAIMIPVQNGTTLSVCAGAAASAKRVLRRRALGGPICLDFVSAQTLVAVS